MQPRRLPNIILFFADDLGYADLGCFGSKTNPTPNLDRLAASGNRFTSFYSAQAVCSASRAGLLTGCYPNRIGIHGALGPNSKNGISSDEQTIGEMLKTRGYTTAVIGKWHLGHQEMFHPNNHGFDFSFGYPYSNDMWPRHPEAPKAYPPLQLRRNREVVDADVTPESMRNITADCTREALGFIDRNHKQPFFLYMPYSMPHVPLFASRKWTGRTGKGIYADVIAEIDDSIGQILARVKQLGLTDDTLVIFTSDNGPWLSYGEHAGSRGELREGKGTSWEGGIRVPMIASWPGVIPKGMVTTQPAMTIDIFPTLRRIVGAAPGKNAIDGYDIGENLAAGDTAGADERVYWTYYNTNELQAVRKGRWKLILPHTYRTLMNQPVAKGGKPVSYTNVKTPLALYDIYTDPAETLDMSAKRPVVLRAMLAEAERARVELGDTLTGKARGRGTRPPGLVS